MTHRLKYQHIPVHVTRMKTFEHDPKRTDPLAIAARDNEEFEIDFIVSHSGNPKRKSDMDFLVRWIGYDES